MSAVFTKEGKVQNRTQRHAQLALDDDVGVETLAEHLSLRNDLKIAPASVSFFSLRDPSK